MKVPLLWEQNEVAALERADIFIGDWHQDSLLASIFQFLWPWANVVSSVVLVVA